MLAKFNKSTATHGSETNEHFEQCLQDLTTYVFPKNALKMQKCYMNHYMRKPREMSTRDYVARVNELNDYLTKFPPINGNPPSKMPDEQLLDILEYGVPSSWQQKFAEHGYDPIEGTFDDFVNWCERWKFMESHISTGTKSKPESKTGKNGPKLDADKPVGNNNKKCKGAGDDYDPNKFCEYHQCYGHDLSTCKVMLAQAKSMCGVRNVTAGCFANKTWVRGEHIKQQQKKKEELCSIVEAMVNKEMKKSTSGKKRKNTEEVELTEENVDEFFQELQVADEANATGEDTSTSDEESCSSS